MLGLELCPDLFEHPTPPSLHHPVALLHVPHVSPAGLATSLSRTSRSRLPRLPDGTFGWRRRGVLLLTPGLAAMAEGGAQLPGPGMAGARAVFRSLPGAPPSGSLPAGSEPPLYTPAEVQALMAAALAPMCLPGGGGWRMDTTGEGGPDAGVGAKERLAVADAMSGVVLADVAPVALMERLPVQLSAKWERVYRALSRVALGCVSAGDRASLVVVQALDPCVTAVGGGRGG